MGEHTTISWTDVTYNPWQGCLAVSPGCDNCYARVMAEHWGKDFANIHRSAPATFQAPRKWQREVERGLRAKGSKVFTCSISDFFIRQADPWREEAWDIMLACPDLIFQVLTKRPGRMAWWAKTHPWPDHIWAGASVESAPYLPRLDVLAQCPAAVRFVSCEPLLGPLDLGPWLQPWGHRGVPDLQWVIVGGQSGVAPPSINYRLMQTEWVQSIADQCADAGVPLFVKQAAAFRPGQQGRIPDDLWALKEFPTEAK